MGRTRSPARLVFMAWNVMLVAWVALAAARGALGPGLLAELALAWFAVATVGVVFPALEMYGPIVQRGPRGRRTIALTFDDGPHPVTTRRILATLAGTKHRATFFVLGAKARRHPDVLREIQAAGHTIGLHGDDHDRLHSFRMPWRVHRDLVRAARAVEDATGVRPRLYRPPLGHTSVNAAPGVRRAGMLVIGWSTRGLDGMRTQTPDAVVARIAASLTDGDIVMLHDAAERDDYEPASVRALPELLRLLDERGWTSVGVDALIDAAAWSPSSSCSTGAAGGRRMPTIALILLALLARTPSASAQATALPLPDADQQVIATMLGAGVVGQALPSQPIDDVSVYFPLAERTRSFQVTSGPKAGQTQSLSVKKGQRPNGNPAWRFGELPGRSTLRIQARPPGVVAAGAMGTVAGIGLDAGTSISASTPTLVHPRSSSRRSSSGSARTDAGS